MAERKIVYRAHALRRMLQRRINPDDVEQMVAAGEVIEDYPDDYPYPSRLLLGFIETQPLHIVVADNTADNEWIVITAYEPDTARWTLDFRRRRNL